MLNETFCRGMVIRIEIRCFEDARGLLSPIDFDSCGFRPVRAFVVSGVPGSVRGGHGHRTGRQILMLVSGLIEVEVRVPGVAELIRLDSERPALLIEPPVWSRQTYLGDKPAMVVFCDTAYDPNDYIAGIEPVGTDGVAIERPA